MFKYFCRLHLSRPINLFLIIESLLVVWLSFLHTSGAMFPAAVCMTINALLFFFVYGKISYITESSVTKIFCAMALLSILSFSNYWGNSRFTGGLFFGCSDFQLFCYSLVWLNLYLFYYVYIRRYRDIKLIYIFAILFFIFGVINNFRAYTYFRVVNSSMIQHHYYYFPLMCLPLLFLKAKPVMKYLLILIVVLCTVFAFKRAGIFVSVAILMVNIIIDARFKFKRLIVYSLICVGIFATTYSLMENNENLLRLEQRMNNISEDKGSGRLTNLKGVFAEMERASIETQLIGNGFMSFMAKHRRMVDNEIGSMLYYFGWVGLAIYGIMHVILLKRILFIAKHPNPEIRRFLSSYTSFYVVVAIYTMAGEFFTYHYLFCMFFIYAGTVEGLISNKLYGFTNNLLNNLYGFTNNLPIKQTNRTA